MNRYLTSSVFQQCISDAFTQVSKYYSDPANLGAVNPPDEDAISQYVNRSVVKWLQDNKYPVGGVVVDSSNVANLANLVKEVEDNRDVSFYLFTTNQRTETKVGFDYGWHYKAAKGNGEYTSYTWFFQAKQVEMKKYPSLTLEKNAQGVLSNITKNQGVPKDFIPYVNFLYTGNSKASQISVLNSLIDKVHDARPSSTIGGGVVIYSPGGIYFAPSPEVAQLLQALSAGDLAKKPVVVRNAALSCTFLNNPYLLLHTLFPEQAKTLQGVAPKVASKDTVDPQVAADTLLIMEFVAAMEKAKIDDKV